MDNDVQQFLKCLSVIWDSSIESSLFRSVPHFFKLDYFVFWCLVFLSSLYNLEISTLSNVELVKIFFHSVGCRFVLLTMFFALCQWVQAYFHLPPLWGSVWLLALFWGLCFIWTWVLCMAIGMDLFAFFYMLTSSYTSTIFWRCFLFSTL